MEKEKITMEEFLDIYDKGIPTIEDFLGLVNAKDYDFSNDKNKHGKGASKTYRNLSKENGLDEKEKNERIVEKFFTYMIINNRGKFLEKIKNNKESDELFKIKKFSGNYNFIKFYEETSLKVKDVINKYGIDIIDADSNSQLLQDIYKALWDYEVLEFSKDKKSVIKGDTLNSINTTQNILYKFIESNFKDEKEKREKMKTENGISQSVSITFLLSKYLLEKDSNIFQEFINNKEVLEFMKCYHTIGNFMPIAVNCNIPRMQGIAQDYLDVTLLFIYNYYMNEKAGDEGIKRLISPMQEDYKKWLNIFGKGQAGWDNFVKSNYLGDKDLKINFVPKEGNHYGLPRELWKNHFVQVINALLKTEDVLPKNQEQCIEYFTNAKNWISTRGELMVEELANRVNDKKNI